MHAFILAGGFATRLWPLTERRAKPLLPLAGRPILSHLVDRIPRNIPVTVSTNDVFRDDFDAWRATLDRTDVHVRIEDTRSDDQKLGALGATAAWIDDEKIDDDLLLLTGDNYFGFSFDAFLASAIPAQALVAAHDIGDRERAKAFGTVLLQSDNRTVSGFEEKPAEPKTTLVSTGCSLLPSETLPILLEYARKHPDNVGGIFEEFLRRGTSVSCFTFREPWFDIGSFDAYLEATRALVGDKVLLADGAATDASTCEGSVVLGEGSVATASTLRNVVTFEGCRIDDCVLEDCILDRGCVLQGVDLRRQMLREGTTLVRG